MSIIPDTEKNHNDFIDFMIEGSKKYQDVENEQGRMEKQLLIDSKKIWYKTHIINSPHFGRFVYLLEEFGGMAIDAFNHMPKERANTLGNQIMRKIDSYNYSIDAKDSESVRDKNNTQGTMVHVMTRNKIEKHYSGLDETKKSIWQGLIGKETNRASD